MYRIAFAMLFVTMVEFSVLGAFPPPVPVPVGPAIDITTPEQNEVRVNNKLTIQGDFVPEDPEETPPNIGVVVYKKNATGAYEYLDGGVAQFQPFYMWKMDELTLPNGDYFVQAFYMDDSYTTSEVHFKVNAK